MRRPDPLWTAPRVGQDWSKPEVQRLVSWFMGFVDSRRIESRLAHQVQVFRNAISARQRGEDPQCYDARDKAAWYLLQAQNYATDRELTDHVEMVQIAPYFSKLAESFDALLSIPGVEGRAEDMLGKEKAHPDSVLFELLVALSYKNGGWRVEFIDEAPGIGRRPDMFVYRQGTRWAVECKRIPRSTYETSERVNGKRIAAAFHAHCRDTRRSMNSDIIFKKELKDIDDRYIERALRLSDYVAAGGARYYEDDTAIVRFRPLRWDIANQVLAVDDVFYGGSRMIELFKGEFNHSADHSISADWVPARNRPAFAERVDRASVVSWWSESDTAKSKKARFFKRQLERAEGQLPSDRPSVVHIGCDRHWDGSIEGTRSFLNWLNLSDFKRTNSRLRWLNCSYFLPEATTDPDEVWALNETFDPIKIGSHSTSNPMPGRFLVVPDDQDPIGFD